MGPVAEQAVDTDGAPTPQRRQPPPAAGPQPRRATPSPRAADRPATGRAEPPAGQAEPPAGRAEPPQDRQASERDAGGLWSGATRAVLFAAAASVGSGFAGRRRELLALRADIERAGLDTLAGRKAPRSRVLLIAGRPGSGRTALAEELVRRLAEDYPDGVLRARLATSAGDPVPLERIARDLLAVLGVKVAAGADEDELCQVLREALAGKRALLLFDDAAGAEQVDALLPDAPDSLVVAVSRGPLTGVPDVRPCTLGGLDVSAAIGLLAQYAGATRITVDPTAAQSLVEECGGQPAALVLAGGWLAARPQTSVADAVQRLRELPPAVGDQDRGARPLARAFRLAYEALPPAAARLLRLLVLAPGGWADPHLASALAGCSVPDAEAALEGFVAHGLLRPLGQRQYLVPGCLVPLLRAALRAQERPAEVELAGARMLERTVRQLHACRLAAEPPGSAARRKLAGMPRPLRFPSSAAAAEWLESRLPVLLEAARLAVEDGGLDTLARRLVGALTHALGAHRGAEDAAPELYGLHRLVLDVARRRDLPVEEAAALLNLGDLDARAGRVEESLVRYKHALEAAREAGDPYTTGRSLESIGGTYEDLGDWHRAADWYGRALELRLSRGDRIGEARLYERLGAVHSRTGQWGEALRSWRAAGAAFRRAGNPQGALRAADALDRLGDPGAAEAHRRAARRLAARQRSATYEISGGSAED